MPICCIIPYKRIDSKINFKHFRYFSIDFFFFKKYFENFELWRETSILKIGEKASVKFCVLALSFIVLILASQSLAHFANFAPQVKKTFALKEWEELN